MYSVFLMGVCERVDAGMVLECCVCLVTLTGVFAVCNFNMFYRKSCGFGVVNRSFYLGLDPVLDGSLGSGRLTLCLSNIIDLLVVRVSCQLEWGMDRTLGLTCSGLGARARGPDGSAGLSAHRVLGTS